MLQHLKKSFECLLIQPCNLAQKTILQSCTMTTRTARNLFLVVTIVHWTKNGRDSSFSTSKEEGRKNRKRRKDNPQSARQVGDQTSVGNVSSHPSFTYAKI